MSHHQSAKPVVAATAVMAIEISNESAANLIQSVTVHGFQSAQLPRLIVLLFFPVKPWPFRAAHRRNFS
jgi:hypothetical protein